MIDDVGTGGLDGCGLQAFTAAVLHDHDFVLRRFHAALVSGGEGVERPGACAGMLWTTTTSDNRGTAVAAPLAPGPNATGEVADRVLQRIPASCAVTTPVSLPEA